jgi:hypothetical protein
MATNKKAKTGNKIIVQLNGVSVGLMQSVELQDDYGHEPASGIGDIHVQEYVPAMAGHTLNVEEMVLISGSLREAGVTAINGDQVLEGNVFDVLVMDKESGGLLRKYSKCSYVSGSVSVRKHAILMSSGVLKALDVGGAGA